MNTVAKPQQPLVDKDLVSKLAIQIWLAEGCQSGREMEHWLRAEQIKIALERELGVTTHPHAQDRQDGRVHVAHDVFVRN